VSPDLPVNSFSDPVSHIFRASANDLLIVLPEAPVEDTLATMTAVTRALGDQRGGSGHFDIIFADDFEPERYADYHLLVIGQVTTNAVLAELNDALPQPFSSEDNTLAPQWGLVTYHFAAGYSVGVVELIPSPWNSDRAITVLSGTTLEGVNWAVHAFVTPNLAGNLDFDLSFVRYEDIQSLDSKLFTPGTLDVAVSDVVNEQATTVPGPQTTGTPSDAAVAIAPTAMVIPSPTLTPTAELFARSLEDYKPRTTELGSTTRSIMGILGGLGVVIIGVGVLLSVRKVIKNLNA
jgi:hypothetical protein